MSMKHEFQVDMTCGGCSGAVERVLKKRDDVKDISFDMDNKKVYVTSDASADDLLAVIKKTGKKASYIGTA
ncbi:copper transport protein ATOX1-like [Xenia sp. Carnegie-2017]|uniref:copper transport protein ATOX1-like n=1 Tax=Xenia sp. Carnegie-2017 TaxID=2897299 RepID=UPI001F038CD6|nr:copper transport protein ATOX1-like [Xenia sp. Carnegie-2017]